VIRSFKNDPVFYSSIFIIDNDTVVSVTNSYFLAHNHNLIAINNKAVYSLLSCLVFLVIYLVGISWSTWIFNDKFNKLFGVSRNGCRFCCCLSKSE